MIYVVEVRVFYVGRGSAVLIRLGKPGCGRFKIVDCYEGDRREHPLLRYLQSGAERVSRLEFLVITHPHNDHFLGIGELLKTFDDRLGRLYDCGLDPRALIVTVYGTRGRADERAGDELEAIDRFCRRRKNLKRVGVLATPDVEIYSDSSSGLRVTSLAPPPYAQKTLQKRLARYLQSILEEQMVAKRERRRFVLPPLGSKIDLNDVSSAVLIQHQRCSLVLGGDVLTRHWLSILPDRRVRADAILLSHHGSHTGFPTAYWHGALAKPGTVALVSGEGRCQPSTSVVKYLRSRGSQVFLTSPARRPGRELVRYAQRYHHGQRPRETRAPSANLVVVSDGERIRVRSESAEQLAPG